MCRCRRRRFVSAFILWREKIAIFLKFFLSYSMRSGKIMNPATSNGRRIRWVLGWFLVFKDLRVLKVFKVVKDFKVIGSCVRIPLFRAMRVPISSPARASSAPSYRAWRDPCLPSRPCRLRRCISRCSTVRCPRGCRTE